MTDDFTLRRVVYTSCATSANPRNDRESILASSRRNNGLDGISGVLWFENKRYLQLLEGPPESVGSTLDRIRVDPRHSDLVVLEDSEQHERIFGDWAMAGVPGDQPADGSVRLRQLLRNAPEDVSRLFGTLV